MALVPVGLCNGVATLEDTLEIPQILNIVLFMWPSNWTQFEDPLLLVLCSRELKQNSYVYSSTNYKSQNGETTQTSINFWPAKQKVAYSCNGHYSSTKE
jgi:hypothetical protein